MFAYRSLQFLRQEKPSYGDSVSVKWNVMLKADFLNQ